MAEAFVDKFTKLSEQVYSLEITKQDMCHRGIHKLPPELLLRIFQIGEESERATLPKEQGSTRIQDLATQICSHWRNVAISCPTLWNYIHIIHPGPHYLIARYLARAGPGVLLDLDIKLQCGWCEGLDVGHDDWESQSKTVAELLGFLASHGASTNRWRSLMICSPEPGRLLEFTGILSAETAPALRFLSCRLCHHGRSNGGRYIRDPQKHNNNALELSPFIVPGFRFDRLSWCCIFNPNSPIFSGMTELKFTSWPSRCSPAQLQELLLLNPQLELLSLGTSDLYLWEPPAVLRSFTDCQSIRMPQLHTLTIGTINDLYWVVGVLNLIDAPVLRKLSISSFVCTEKYEGAVKYLCRLPCKDEEGDPTLGKPRYPILNELDIHNFFHREHVIDMFTSWPSIARLYANRAHVELLEDPSMLPHLTHLKIHFKPHPELGCILRCREAAGCPVKEVDLPANGWQDRVQDELPGEVVIKRHDVIDFEIESDDSEAEAEFSEEGESGMDSDAEPWINDEHGSDSEESGWEESEWLWSVHE
ncbi:unnamed protein product [Rhizoctonia solani]|uniref:F-box domain-containing protein n=1 Tax=Rhizoctonia solani TaxID=456999 RepID=A0A8H3DEQ9_9AGAM|nr:unnamed protein product [Rhizoctonia solani]